MPAGRPLQYKTKEEMQSVIDEYFNACLIRKKEQAGIELEPDELDACEITHDIHPTICGLALVLDLSRQSVIDYSEREEFVDTVKRAKLRVESYNEQKLHLPACTGVIFNLKNNFGWKDQTERALSGVDGKDLIPSTVKVIYD